MLTHAISTFARLLDAPVDRPALPLSHADADREFERMRANPVPLVRPVVILAGYRAWSIMPRAMAATFQQLTGAQPDQFLPIAYPWSTNIRSIAGRVARRADRHWPGIEVDVVGVSMGGLVARAAAAGLGGATLPIRRLFTLATPHRGAVLASHLTPDLAAREMRPGSALLAELDAALAHASYELIAYARLRDSWVGASHTAPEGRPLLWVSGCRLFSHITISSDRRILADIARRLRSEPPWPGIDLAPPCD